MPRTSRTCGGKRLVASIVYPLPDLPGISAFTRVFDALCGGGKGGGARRTLRQCSECRSAASASLMLGHRFGGRANEATAVPKPQNGLWHDRPALVAGRRAGGRACHRL